MKRTLLAMLAIAATSASAFAATLAGPLYNPANEHWYYLLTQNTWSGSQAEARSLGGNLATVNDADEQAFIFEYFGRYLGAQRLLWIGLNDVQTEGQFRWVSGEPVTYTNWAPNEPNSAAADEDFVALYYPNHSFGGQWNDWSNRTTDPIGLQFNGVVEIVPEPGALLGIALCGFLTAQRRSR